MFFYREVYYKVSLLQCPLLEVSLYFLIVSKVLPYISSSPYSRVSDIILSESRAGFCTATGRVHM